MYIGTPYEGSCDRIVRHSHSGVVDDEQLKNPDKQHTIFWIIVDAHIIQNEINTVFRVRKRFRTVEAADVFFNDLIKYNPISNIVMYKATRTELKSYI